MIEPVPSHTPVVTTSGGRVWISASPNDEAEVGRRYRLSMTVRAPYTIDNIEKLESSLRYGTYVKNLADYAILKEKITIESFQAHYPKSGAAGTPTWTFDMIFVKTKVGSPLLVIIGAVVLVVTLSILASVVGHTIEKEADKVKDLGQATVFNPFFLIAAVIVVLALTGKSLKSIGGGK